MMMSHRDRTSLAFGLAVAVTLLSFLSSGVAGRPAADPFCQDPPDLYFCSVLAGQGAPLPPPIPADETVQVWVLQAPIWKFACADCGNITEKLKLIHTAIGLVNVDSGDEYLFEFEGIFESPNATFPYVVANESYPGGQEIKWCNQGAVCFANQIDWSYFSHLQAHVADTNGTVFNELMKWMSADNDTESIYYESFGVYDAWDGPDSKPYVTSYTCDDYAWKVLGIMAGTWDVEFFSNVSISRDFLNFYSDEPVAANMTDPAVYAEVAEWYSMFDINGLASSCAGLTGTEFDICVGYVVIKLTTFLETARYVYADGVYHQVKLHGDRFNWQYDVTDITPITLTPEQLKLAQSYSIENRPDLYDMSRLRRDGGR